jgi:hypothetical protein
MLCKTWWESISMKKMVWRAKEELLHKRAGFRRTQTICSIGSSPSTVSPRTSSSNWITCS